MKFRIFTKKKTVAPPDLPMYQLHTECKSDYDPELDEAKQRVEELERKTDRAIASIQWERDLETGRGHT